MYSGHLSIMLYVSDLKQSVEFYHEKLGFGFTGYWDDVNHRVTDNYEEANRPGYASVKVGESKIGLHLDPSFEAGPRRFEFHVEIENADAHYAELQAKGLDLTEPKDESWGARMFSVTDPDGHVLDFLQPLEEK